MSHSTCCIIDCRNNGRNSQCKFYTFSTARCRIDQRKKWITAVRRVNPDGSPWQPKPSDLICSAHFIGHEKSNDPLNPSYVPTIFPPVYKTKKVNSASKISRHARFIEKRQKKELISVHSATKKKQAFLSTDVEMQQLQDQPGTHKYGALSLTSIKSETFTSADKGCQVDIYFDCIVRQKTFICNRYIYNNFNSDIEIQTEIPKDNGKIIVPISQKICKDKECGTPQKTYVHQLVGPISCDRPVLTFFGYRSMKNEQELLDLAGVTLETFKFLLNLCKNSSDVGKILKKDKLLIFLIKIKTGLTFSAIGVLFSLHRITISRIFFSILQELSSVSGNLIFWPEKTVVKATMPQYFNPDYGDTRVIIDCREFKIEVPKSADNRMLNYSHYKKGFTVKALIGMTPGGFICFKSKVAGGGMIDSELTTKSGLIDLLENGDKVLAVKDFPEIQKTIDQADKNITLVVPQDLENKEKSDENETETMYRITKVRIHIEKMMQRIRTYQILNKISPKLFNHVDALLHVCCILVNLQVLKRS